MIRSILGIVFVVLLTLKLVGVEPVASWSWWLVLAPVLALVGVVVALLGGAWFVGLGQQFSQWRKARARVKWAKQAAKMEEEDLK